jgi:ubiquitin-protein ligase
MAWSKRSAKDIKDLTDNGFVVLSETMGPFDDNLKCFCVQLVGPKDTAYENAKYHVRFTISDN